MSAAARQARARGRSGQQQGRGGAEGRKRAHLAVEIKLYARGLVEHLGESPHHREAQRRRHAARFVRAPPRRLHARDGLQLQLALLRLGLRLRRRGARPRRVQRRLLRRQLLGIGVGVVRVLLQHPLQVLRRLRRLLRLALGVDGRLVVLERAAAGSLAGHVVVAQRPRLGPLRRARPLVVVEVPARLRVEDLRVLARRHVVQQLARLPPPPHGLDAQGRLLHILGRRLLHVRRLLRIQDVLRAGARLRRILR